jgi:hypothetical protein
VSIPITKISKVFGPACRKIGLANITVTPWFQPPNIDQERKHREQYGKTKEKKTKSSYKIHSRKTKRECERQRNIESKRR